MTKTIFNKKTITKYIENGRAFELLSRKGDLYTVFLPNDLGERMQFELTECYPDNSNKHSLPNIWYKNGFINTRLNSYFSLNTYVTTDKGDCYGWYNPQVKLRADGKGLVINFDYMLECNTFNKETLIIELLTRFYSCSQKLEK